MVAVLEVPAFQNGNEGDMLTLWLRGKSSAISTSGMRLMKPIYLSRHARRRMRRYGITEEEVLSVLTMPHHVEPSVKGRINAIKEEAGRILRVTYAEEAHRIVVVTVSPRRRI